MANKFHNEFSLVVSSSPVSFEGTLFYINTNVSELLPRGDSSSSRILILSGSHGSENGEDALCSLEALSSSNKDKPDQTRIFYQLWCKKLKLNVEGEDPRQYSEDGKVVGVSEGQPPMWREREPRTVERSENWCSVFTFSLRSTPSGLPRSYWA